MYTLGVRRDFIARHFLIGGDWGSENFPNSHHYILELQLEGRELDQHGYLVDILDVEKHLDDAVWRPLTPYLEAITQVRAQDLEPTPQGGVQIRQGVAPDRRISIEDAARSKEQDQALRWLQGAYRM